MDLMQKETDERRLSGKVGIITGASRGIGKAIALEAVREGAKVVVNYKNDEKSAKETLQQLENISAGNGLVQADVSRYNAVERMIKETIARYEHLDFVVNNAGIIRDAQIERMHVQDWNDVLQTNLYGPFYVMKLALPHLRRTKGSIVNISSSAGERGTFGQANYAASKFGLEALSKVAAREFGRYGIRVNAVSPPFVKTDSFRRHDKKDVIEKRAMGESALGKHGEAEDVAHFVIYLLTDKAKNVTGRTFWLDSRMYTLP